MKEFLKYYNRKSISKKKEKKQAGVFGQFDWSSICDVTTNCLGRSLGHLLLTEDY